MSSSSGPHDAVFRRVFGEPANAASQLRAVLPAGLVDRLDLGRLRRVPSSFVDTSLRWRHSDLLLAVDLRRWAEDLRAVLERPGGVEDFVALVTYIENVGEAPTEELHDLFAQLGPRAEEAYVTTAEMLRAEGEARGRAEGRAEALVQLLSLKFGPLPPAALKVVHAASSDQLATWTGRVLGAGTLDEVLS